MLTISFLILFELFGLQRSGAPRILRSVPSETARDSAMEAALKKFEGPLWTGSKRYYYNRVDLNGDGKLEVIAYLDGPNACGTGGCNTVVFRLGQSGYEVIADVYLTWTPVIVSNCRTKGWQDLIFPVGGGGSPSYYAVLPFDGKTYPERPTVEPAHALEGGVEGVAYLIDVGKPGSGVHIP